MERGVQSLIALSVLLFLVNILFIASLLIPRTTGNLSPEQDISAPAEDLPAENQNQDSQNKITQGQPKKPSQAIGICEISYPFECRIWSFSADSNELNIQITNLKPQEYMIRTAYVSNCLYHAKITKIEQSSSRSLKFSCASADDNFDNAVFIVNYTAVDVLNPVYVSKGRINYSP